MAYNALNNLIDAYIYANGVQAITGQILNGVLKQMVSQLGSGYHLMGVAGPETTPEQNDFAMAYFAATAGEYTDFGGITLGAGEVAVLLTSGNGSWEKQTIYTVPTTTEDLENTAGFITNAVTDLVNYYTKTEVDTTLADYPTLEALATALADYYTKQEVDTTLDDYATKDGVDETLEDYYTKDEVDAELGDRYTKQETDTKLGDYYKKTETYDKDEVDSIVAALSRQEYIVAWDGLAAPDVSAIPAGVTVTYNATPYTGTLAASASTVNKIYMVWNGVAYDMYGTSQDGGYSWVPMGTTSVDLSQYATKAEVSQLQQKVDETQGFFPFILDKFINTSGNEQAGNGWQTTGWIPLSKLYGVGTYGIMLTTYPSIYDPLIYPVLFKDGNDVVTYLESAKKEYAASAIPQGTEYVAFNFHNRVGPVGINVLLPIVDYIAGELETAKNNLSNISQFKYISSVSNALAPNLVPGLYGVAVNATNVPESYDGDHFGWMLKVTDDFRLLWSQSKKRFWAKLQNNDPWFEMSGDSFTFTTDTASGILSVIQTAIDSGAISLSGTPITPDAEYPRYLLSYTTGKMVAYDDPLWNVNKYLVNPGEAYRVKASKQYQNCFFVFYDSSDNVVLKVGDGTSAAATFDKLVCVPNGASYILVAYKSDLNIGELDTPILSPGVGVGKWQGKKWVAVGDSLTEVNGRTTKNYLAYISEKTGITTVNMGLSGSGYRKKYDTNQAFYQRVANIPTDADVVTIFGSGNDLSLPDYDLGQPSDTGTSTICGCVNNTLDSILTLFMTAGKVPVIGIITPTPWVGAEPNQLPNNMENYCVALVEICKRRGVPCLDLYHCSNLHPSNATFRTLAYSKDDGNGVHPDETGHKIISPMIENFLEGLIL